MFKLLTSDVKVSLCPLLLYRLVQGGNIGMETY